MTLGSCAVDLTVDPAGLAHWGERAMRCALGRGGVRPDKREGDGATPIGCFPLRRVLFRADRLSRPASGLPVSPLDPRDGWCDDPQDPLYNRPVRLPYAGRHERLWRQDEVYDVIVFLGHNDAPVVPGRGSAVFLHVARPDFTPTEGCVALTREDLLSVVAQAGIGDRMIVSEPPG